MYKYHESLQSSLRSGAEFALVALPAKLGKRAFHFFTKQGDDRLSNVSGNTLYLQPFDSGQAKDLSPVDEKDHYLKIVNQAVQSIRAGALEKVVLARTKTIANVQWDMLPVWYEGLLEAYPNALVFVVSTKESGTWIGASPELIVEKSGSRFHTIALAGTNKMPDPTWPAKDHSEHQKVVDYIERELLKLKISPSLDGPYTSRYGAMSHLRTDVNFTSTVSLREIVARLHPTPALCGSPKDATLRFIAQHEARQRSFYTGNMIIEDKNGDGVAFAFLRCAQLTNDAILRLYAGCGIVAESIPEKEWEESELKIDSILRLMPNSL